MLSAPLIKLLSMLCLAKSDYLLRDQSAVILL